MNIIECGQYNDLKKRYREYQSLHNTLRADRTYYQRITREAAALLANNLQIELQAEVPNVAHATRLINELEVCVEILTLLESLP